MLTRVAAFSPWPTGGEGEQNLVRHLYTPAAGDAEPLRDVMSQGERGREGVFLFFFIIFFSLSISTPTQIFSGGVTPEGIINR